MNKRKRNLSFADITQEIKSPKNLVYEELLTDNPGILTLKKEVFEECKKEYIAKFKKEYIAKLL